MRVGWLGALSVVVPPLAASSCDLDFTDPVGSQPAVLTVWLEVLSGEESEFRVTGGFSPGSDGGGMPRKIADDRLTILGHSFVPRGATSQAALTYEETWVPSSIQEPGPLELWGPRVEGIIDPPPLVRFRLCRGEASEVDRLAPTDTLHLSISCPFHDPDVEADWLDWELRVTSAEAGSQVLVRLRGSAGPPTEIALPADWISMDESPAIVLEMDVREGFVRENLALQYDVRMTVRSIMRWELDRE